MPSTEPLQAERYWPEGNPWAYLCSQVLDLGRDVGEAESISVTHSGHWSWLARYQQEGLVDSPL